MTKKNKTLKWILILGIIVVAVLVFTPFLDIVGFTEPGLCSETPYNQYCFCADGFRKISVPYTGIARWRCEELEKLLIDPESETFESDAINFVQNYLRNSCGEIYTDPCNGQVCGCPEDNPNCGSFEMTHPVYPDNACISPVFGWGSQGARMVNVECMTVTNWNTPSGELSHEDTIATYGEQPNEAITPKGGKAPWRMQFFVESETEIPTTLDVFKRSNYCWNDELGKKCAPQSYCDSVANSQYSIDNPGWCVGELVLNLVPNDYPFAVFDVESPKLGSGYSSP